MCNRQQAEIKFQKVSVIIVIELSHHWMLQIQNAL